MKFLTMKISNGAVTYPVTKIMEGIVMLMMNVIDDDIMEDNAPCTEIMCENGERGYILYRL